MTEQDEKINHVAMTIRAFMGSLTELISIAQDGNGYELVRNDIDDLELAHARLGTFLDTLHQPLKQVA